MMKKIFIFLLLVTVFSCDPNDYPAGPSANLYLNISATFNGEPLVIGQPYSYPDGNSIRIDEFSFFIAGVTVNEEETAYETDLLEVGLADFTDQTDPANVRSVTFPVYSVPAVPYSGLDMHIGVPSKFNKESVLNLGIGHPVRDAYDTHFWEEDGSFFFVKIAGVYDLNGDGVFTDFPEDHPFEHFTFGNDNYIRLVLDRNIIVEDGNNLDVNLNVELSELYIEPLDNKPLDLEEVTNRSTYAPLNPWLNGFLTQNMRRALTIE